MPGFENLGKRGFGGTPAMQEKKLLNQIAQESDPKKKDALRKEYKAIRDIMPKPPPGK